MIVPVKQVVISFLHELFFFFINSLLSFPLYVKRIIIFFLFIDHKSIIVYHSLTEEDLYSCYIVDFDFIHVSQSLEKTDVHISILPEDHPSCKLVEIEIDIPPPQMNPQSCK